MHFLSSHSFLLSILLLHSGNHVLGAPNPKPRAECTPAVHSFDYVIVGGGTAGLVLANRLTENADINVAVIEAGTNPEVLAGNLTQVPGYAGQLYLNAAELNWGFSVTPQEVFTRLAAKSAIGLLTRLSGSLEPNCLVHARKSGRLLPLLYSPVLEREHARD